jgi:predicted ATPase
VLREDPADEAAHRALMRRLAARGDRARAAQQFRLLCDHLARAGAAPSEETLALRRRLTRGPAVHAPRVLDTGLEGRERELERARGAVRRAAEGDGGALLIRGAFGLGKTRLLEAVLAEAEHRGFHTLRGAAHDDEVRAPYAPLAEALDPLVARRPELAAALAEGPRAVLARLLPSARPPAATPADPADRHLVFFAVAQLVAEAAAERGAIVAVDDLHAADEATTALVHHLARGAVGTRLLVIAAIHEEPLDPHVARMRSALLEQGAAEELTLPPLDGPAIAAVAARAAGRSLRAPVLREVQRCAAGNPLFAEELAASVDASGTLTVPPRLQAVLGRRLDRLPPLREAVLAALAVVDDGFTSADLAALVTDGAVGPALEAALAAGVLDRTGERHRFRHALVPRGAGAPPRTGRMPSASQSSWTTTPGVATGTIAYA